MVIVNDVYIDGYLQKSLDIAKKAIKNDWDMVFCIDGIEGSGKSVVGLQMAYYCDPTLTIDRVCFTASEFKRAILKATQYQAVIFDEAFTGLSSRDAMSKINKSLVQMLAEIRQKNLFVFVIMPSFFDLDKYVALHRSRALIHVYTGDGFKRGYLSFYNIDRKRELYINGKKYYNYYLPKPNFRGAFTNTYPISEEVYRAKKKESLRSKDVESEDVEFKQKFNDELLLLLARVPLGLRLTIDLRCKMLGITGMTYYNRIKRLEEDKDIDNIEETVEKGADKVVSL